MQCLVAVGGLPSTLAAVCVGLLRRDGGKCREHHEVYLKTLLLQTAFPDLSPRASAGLGYCSLPKCFPPDPNRVRFHGEKNK